MLSNNEGIISTIIGCNMQQCIDYCFMSVFRDFLSGQLRLLQVFLSLRFFVVLCMCFRYFNVVVSTFLIWYYYSNSLVVITEREPSSLKPFLDPVGVRSCYMYTVLR